MQDLMLVFAGGSTVPRDLPQHSLDAALHVVQDGGVAPGRLQQGQPIVHNEAQMHLNINILINMTPPSKPLIISSLLLFPSSLFDYALLFQDCQLVL